MCFADKILMTTFRQCVIPPPMCAFELQLPVPVNLVTFHSQAQRTNELAALTADGHIYVYGEEIEEIGHIYVYTLEIETSI